MQSWLNVEAPFFTWLWQSSWQAAVLVLLVILIHWMFGKRLSAAWKYNLWLLVALRLLVPFSPESMFSIFNWAKPETLAELAPESITTPPPSTVVLDQTMEAEPVLAKPKETSTSPPESTDVQAMSDSFPPARQSPEQRTGAWSWSNVWPSLWLLGVLGLSAKLVVQNIRFGMGLRRSPPIRDPAVLDLLEKCHDVMKTGLRWRAEGKLLPVIETNLVKSPALYGCFRPCLVLPAGMTSAFSPQELRFVFLHELAHLKRRDPMVNWLMTILGIFHWFNPFVWIALHRMRAERELACDDLVLSKAAEGENCAYGRTIIKLLEQLGRPATVPMVGILEDKRQLEQRIRTIANFRRRGRWSVLAVFLLLGLGLATLTGERTGGAAEPENSGQSAVDKTGSGQHFTVQVVEAENAEPVAGARLTYQSYPPNEKEFFTAENGIAEIPVPELEDRSSTFVVYVNHDDFAPRAIYSVSANGYVRDNLPEKHTVELGRGIRIGGVVQQDNQKPIPGVRVFLKASNIPGYTIGSGEISTEDYSDIRPTVTDAVAVTDAEGRWKYDNFPADLESVIVELVRPDNSRVSSASETVRESPSVSAHERFRLAELIQQEAVFDLPQGVTTQGRVVNQENHPVAEARVIEGYGHGNITVAGTVTTDAQGRFVLPNRVPRDLILTVESEAHATKSAVVRVEPDMPEVEIQLEPKQPFVGQVVDGQGTPIPDARIRPLSYDNPGMILRWEGRTDPEGRFKWESAPDVPVVLQVSADGFPDKRISKSAGQSEATIQLRKDNKDHVTLTGKVLDRQTHRPLAEFRAFIDYQGNGFRLIEKGTDGVFTRRVDLSDFKVGIVTTYRIRIEAEGYEPLISRRFDFEEGDVSEEFALRKGREITGKIVLPDGQPAERARVLLHVEGAGGFPGLPNEEEWSWQGDKDRFYRTGADGEFSFAPAPEAKRVVVSHEAGYGKAAVEDLRKSSEISLNPWAKVKGIFRIGAEPAANQPLYLKTLHWNPYGSIRITLETTADADGRFVFDYVPAGEYQLYRRLPIKRPGLFTASHQMHVEVRPGETVEVDYGGSGRPVVGQIRVLPPGTKVDWSRTDRVLELKQPDLPRPVWEDYASSERFRKADRAYFESEEVKELHRNKQTYVLDFDQDGSFRAEDVLPGTYELVVRVLASTSSKPAWDEPKELGAVRQETVVPEIPGGRTDNPLDLGTFELKLGAAYESQTAKSAEKILAQAQAKARTEDKVLFVHFGASWCGWCKRLEAFLESKEIQPIFQKYFIDVKLVVHEDQAHKHFENAGAEEFLRRLGGPAGLPYYAFLDAQMKLIVNSHRSVTGDNIGYPVRPKEIAWFLKMVRKAASTITDSELKTMQAWLDNPPE